VIFGALQASALEGLEQIINGVLIHDPASAQQLAKMQGKIILIDSSLPAIRVAVEPSTKGIILHHNWSDAADITVTGSLVAIAGMAINSAETVSLSGTGVNVSGNLELLRQLNQIMAGLDIDWEAALAELVGEIPAHLIAESIRNSAQYGTAALQRAQTALAEVSQEELRLTPSKNEFDEFMASVRHVTADIDRLTARANKLRLMIKEGAASQ
jgi:ubiquinone biosynthesis accessory factor UbiJ